MIMLFCKKLQGGKLVKKSFLFGLLALIMLLSLPAFVQGNDKPNTFTDTVDHWAEDYISEAVELGFFKGTDDNVFEPDACISRAQFITVLWRMSGEPETELETSFLDISHQPLEFKKAIYWGYNNGYINGASDTRFAPEDALTREAAMKILYYLSGGQSGSELLFTAVYDNAFADSGDISLWAKPCVYWGFYNKLISGTSKEKLSPKDNATRAQMAKILVEYYHSFVD